MTSARKDGGREFLKEKKWKQVQRQRQLLLEPRSMMKDLRKAKSTKEATEERKKKMMIGSSTHELGAILANGEG